MQTILVADDNLVNLSFICGQLQEEYRVIPVKSGEQALKACQRSAPDLILLDVNMPGMNGFDVLVELSNNPITAHIPVIFLTADHDAATQIKGLELGAADFITKPFERGIMLHRLEHHLRFAAYQHRLEKNVKELEDSIVLSFSEILECRDSNTGGHVSRTAKYVALLCEGLMQQKQYKDILSPEACELIVRAAPLHDIGKIGINDSILQKPGKLTAEEFEVMKTHTTIGAAMLLKMSIRTPSQRYLKYAVMIAEKHHERWDGTGYPEGLQAESIPLCARIMAVADVYDALTDDRCYRKRMTCDDAFQFITEKAGIHFDPVIVEVLRKYEEQFEQYKNSSIGT